MTYAMAFNSYGGGNLSMSFVQNHNTNSYTHTACRAISAAVQHAMAPTLRPLPATASMSDTFVVGDQEVPEVATFVSPF